VESEDDHRHCKVCGRVCPTDEEVCSKTCRTKRETVLKAKRNYTYLLYGLIAFLLLILLLGVVRV
jgi:predicted nucleic acid-binding Zn ribbon protein